MNLDLNYEGFEDYLLNRILTPPMIDIFRQKLIDGVQYLFKFENGYGASVVKHWCSYGYREDLWELGVLYFESENPVKYHLSYNTPITDDVIGYLTDEEVRELLGRIKALPG